MSRISGLDMLMELISSTYSVLYWNTRLEIVLEIKSVILLQFRDLSVDDVTIAVSLDEYEIVLEINGSSVAHTNGVGYRRTIDLQYNLKACRLLIVNLLYTRLNELPVTVLKAKRVSQERICYV
jgi:hypothetical protein